MKSQFSLITATLALALLAGCSENKSPVNTADGTISIKGSTSAALQVIAIADANDEVLQTGTTDSVGDYEVLVPDNAEFPLVVRAISDTDTVCTAIPSPDSANPREIRANVNELTDHAFRAWKGPHDGKKPLARPEWDSIVRADAPEWALEAKDMEHNRALMTLGACMDSNFSINLDSLKIQEETMVAAHADLIAQMQSGDLDREDFIAKMDSSFAPVRQEIGRAVASCRTALPLPDGIRPPFRPLDSGVVPEGGCPVEKITQLEATATSLNQDLQAGAITEESFLSGMMELRAECDPPRDPAPEPLPVCDETQMATMNATESSLNADLQGDKITVEAFVGGMQEVRNVCVPPQPPIPQPMPPVAIDSAWVDPAI
jgi:hypothetical protein